jgi:hypothetical protein
VENNGLPLCLARLESSIDKEIGFKRYLQSRVWEINRQVRPLCHDVPGEGNNAEMQSTLILAFKQEEQMLEALSTNECNDCDETRLEQRRSVRP